MVGRGVGTDPGLLLFPGFDKLHKVVSPDDTSHFGVAQIQMDLHVPLMSIPEFYQPVDRDKGISLYVHDCLMCLNECKLTTMAKTSAFVRHTHLMKMKRHGNIERVWSGSQTIRIPYH